MTAFLIAACAIGGAFGGYYAALFLQQAKAKRLEADLATNYPREFEIWKCGYKQALHDIFDGE